jgi:hypothetical protein
MGNRTATATTADPIGPAQPGHIPAEVRADGSHRSSASRCAVYLAYQFRHT